MQGLNAGEILDRLNGRKTGNGNWRDGKMWSLVYHHSDEHTELLKQAYSTHFSENALNPTAFPSLQRLEREIVQIAGTLFNAPEGFSGTFQSGGTESIMIAMLVYRDRGRKKGIEDPEIVLSEGAHVAFHKAAHCFGIKTTCISIDERHQFNLSDFEKAITRNTVALVGSAPAYPSGQVDPLAELSRIALAHNLPLHVDACVGGFFLPFVEDFEPWDFRLAGVTSISADIHKYGYSAKGASVLIWRDEEWLKEQIYVYTDWPGGVYASSGLLGTRPGGAHAAAWASLMSLGENGFRKTVQAVLETTSEIKRRIAQIGELEILGNPKLGLFAIVSKEPSVSVYAVADLLEEKGWFIDRQMRPESIHCTVTPAHFGKEQQFADDLKAAVEKVIEEPGRALSGKAAQYGLLSHLPARKMVEKEVRNTMGRLITGSGNAEVNVTGWQRWLLRWIR